MGRITEVLPAVSCKIYFFCLHFNNQEIVCLLCEFNNDIHSTSEEKLTFLMDCTQRNKCSILKWKSISWSSHNFLPINRPYSRGEQTREAKLLQANKFSLLNWDACTYFCMCIPFIGLYMTCFSKHIKCESWFLVFHKKRNLSRTDCASVGIFKIHCTHELVEEVVFDLEIGTKYMTLQVLRIFKYTFYPLRLTSTCMLQYKHLFFECPVHNFIRQKRSQAIEEKAQKTYLSVIMWLLLSLVKPLFILYRMPGGTSISLWTPTFSWALQA